MNYGKMGNTWHTPLISQKSDTQNLHSTPLRKHWWGVRNSGMMVPTTMLRLPKNGSYVLKAMSINGKNVHEISEIEFFVQ